MTDSIQPKFHGNINFNAQHSPMGGFFSFTCGHFGTPGGFGLQIGKPGNQDIYIGVKEGDAQSDAPLKCLPFFTGAAGNGAEAFLVSQSGPATQNAAPKVVAYETNLITRRYGWATDQWETPDFSFSFFTPFGSIPDPAEKSVSDLRRSLLPAVVGELVVDNSNGKTIKTACFALRFPDGGLWANSESLDLGHRSNLGVRAVSSGSAFTFMSWTPDQGIAADPQARVHLLGVCAGFAVEVKPGERATLRVALGTYLRGIQTRGLEGSYLYTRYFAGLDDVLDTALSDFDRIATESSRIDAELLHSKVSADQQFMIAHSTRSYYGSTELLEVGGQPFWIVNEGEYCMLNTLDLSVDHVFWELKQNPWVIKNLLDNFVRFYSYQDRVKDRNGNYTPGGISFCHDMGGHNNFSPLGNSSYELPNLNALCFSYMTAEQLCNWILIAASYVSSTGDKTWASTARPTIDACLESLINRCDENGFPAYDSSRCGPGGAEITTYDSLDHSLAQTRNNLYMIVKTWASFGGLELIYGALEDSVRSQRARAMLQRIETALPSRSRSDGALPAVFEPDNSGYESRILPAIEGLVYPLFWTGNLKTAGSDFLQSLLKHTLSLLKDPKKRNFFKDGGIRLSSTSDNSWVSKIAIFMHVSRDGLDLGGDPAIAEVFTAADSAHVKWETEGPSAYWAMSDQMVNGIAHGSKYYPRCITTALLLNTR